MSKGITEIIDNLNVGLDNNKWINDKLETTSKNGRFIRVLKAIFQPLVRLFGGDLFRHVRIHNIVLPLLNAVNQNKDAFDNDEALKQSLNDILNKLKHRVKGNQNKNRIDIVTNTVNNIFSFKPEETIILDAKDTTPPPPAPPLMNSNLFNATDPLATLKKNLKNTNKTNPNYKENQQPSSNDLMGQLKKTLSNRNGTDQSKIDELEKKNHKKTNNSVNYRSRLNPTGIELQ